MIAQPKVEYKYGYEAKARALNGFRELFNAKDLEVRRSKLIAGLSKESVDVIDLLLHRLKAVLELKEGESVDLYTKAEIEAFKEQEQLLFDKIVEIAPDFFVWNGYALPCRHYEPNVFWDEYGLRYLKTLGNIGDKAIIDAGAYIGDSALLLSPLTKGRVFAFEPVSDNFRLLEKTISLNGLANVIPVHSALGECAGNLKITIGDTGACATGKNTIPCDAVKHEMVDVVKLDDFVQKEGVSVGLIKTDVEGAEQMLLHGAKEIIKRDRPILIISIYHNVSDFFDIKPLIESWNLGYQFIIYHPPIRSISGGTVLICEHKQQECSLDLLQHNVQDENPVRGALRIIEKQIATSKNNTIELVKSRDAAWRRHDKVAGELKEARQTLCDRYAQLEETKKSREEAWQRHDKVAGELKEARRTLRDRYAQLEETKKSREEAWRLHDKVAGELKEARQTLRDRYAQLEETKKSRDAAWQRHDKVAGELKEARQTLRDRYTQLEETKKSRDAAWQRHDKVAGELKEARSLLKKRWEERKVLLHRCEASDAKCRQLMDTIDQLNNKLNNCTERTLKAEEQNETLTAFVGKLKKIVFE